MSNDYAKNALGSRHFYLVVAFIAAFAGILFGYDTGVISGAILFISDQFKLSPQMNGIVVSSVLIGALVGAIFSGRLADHFGRKRMLILDSIIFIVGTLITCFAPNILTIIIGRIVVGVAIGISSYIGPLYISEIAPTKHRGALVSLNQLAITIGILISYVVDYIAAIHGYWRIMFGFGVVPAIALLIGMLTLPSSPRWMLSRGDEQQAMAILNRIRGFSPAAKQEFELIKASFEQQKGNWRMLFQKNIRVALLIGAGLAVIQQVTGINTILYYAPTIFKMAGFYGADNAILATMGVGAFLVLFTVLSLALIDTWGRRPLLLMGLTLMAASLAVLSWTFHVHQNTPFLRWFTLLSMLAYICAFAISLGPVVWLLISEVFPLRVRGIGSSLATSVCWGSNWLIALTFLTLVHWLSLSGTFLIYFSLSIASMLFVYNFVPETKGVSLEEIEMNLLAGKPSRFIGNKP